MLSRGQIKIFYTPFRFKGSTENLLKSAIKRAHGHDYSKILYISPTPRKIRDSQRIFHKLARGCYIPPEMMTIKQLSKRLYSLYGDRNVISPTLIPIIISRLSDRGIGFSSIIADFINEIKQYHPGKNIETIRNELKAIFYDLGIPEEVSKRALYAIEVFKTYHELLNSQNVLDENDVMVICPSLIERYNYSPDVFILDGFYEITSSEEAILKTLIERAKATFISIPYDNNFTETTESYVNFIKNNFQAEEVFLTSEEKPLEPLYIPYPGIEEEVEGIARHIKNSFISGRRRDLEKITLTFPKLHQYSDILERVFRRYGIPYTLSTSKPDRKKRPFLDLISLLESVADDYPRLPFSQSLVSPYFKNMPEVFRKWIPRLYLSSGIIKGKDSWLNLTKTVSIQRSAVSASEINKGLQWVFKKLAPLEIIKNKGTYSQYSEVIVEVLNDLGFSCEEMDLPNMVRSAYGEKEQTLNILKGLFFIDELSAKEANLRDFIDALKHILNSTETEIEGTGVQVMGFLETRGIEPEFLYFGGLKDGDLPSKPEIDHILPDSVRTRFRLVNLKKYLLLQKFTFQRLIDSSKSLHLSYPVMDSDKFFLPSPFLSWNRETEERVFGIFSMEEELIRQGKMPLSSHIREIEGMKDKLIKERFGENSYIRVTDIDYYRTCARKFFIEKMLNLEAPEAKEYEVEAALLGTIAHEIMETLISKPFTSFDDLRYRADETLDKLLSEKPIENYWKKLIRDSFLYILPELYELENKLRDEGYSFMRAEVPVEGEPIKGIKLKGKIDRIDRKDWGEVELIDYKTGSALFSGPQVMTKGATLQLFLYAALMKSLGFKVERVGIYSLKDINLTWIPGRNDKREKRTIEDYIEISLRFLEEIISRMREGDFSASPLNEQTCRNCSERPYCPYIQGKG